MVDYSVITAGGVERHDGDLGALGRAAAETGDDRRLWARLDEADAARVSSSRTRPSR